MIFFIWIAVFIAAVVLQFRQFYSRFSENDVKHYRAVPFLGNMTRTIFHINSFTYELERLYCGFPEERSMFPNVGQFDYGLSFASGHLNPMRDLCAKFNDKSKFLFLKTIIKIFKFVGRYEFLKPVLLIRDLELVKKITIRDIDSFLDHRNFTDEKTEPLFARNLFSLKGQEWRDMRATLSPAFTSSKIKLMVPFMEEVGEQMIQALKRKTQESPDGSIDVDCKDLTTRYANDVIASCAFGLKVDSHTDEKNQFYEMGKRTATFNLKKMIFIFFFSACPWLTKILKLSLFSNQTKDFFKDIVMSTMKKREALHIFRPDMIYLLMEAKKGQLTHDEKVPSEDGHSDRDTGFATVEESAIGKKNVDRVWSDDDLVAQALLFFIAGFETTSTGMSFALHEIAVNPEIQERLYKEIKDHYVKHDGKINFTSIQNMIYLDMVISEALRLWPPGVALDRVCVKDYNLGKPNPQSTKDYIIRKGELLNIPTWCFHHDAKYFPNPLKFDPERFSDENKHLINPNAYMPFGLGPRNCIGSRFALCELKSLLYHILLHHEVSPSEKTQLPAKLSTETINPRIKGGHWLKFKLRA